MPIRILHIVNYMDRGGLETMLMNCYRHMDRDQIQFDFLVHRSFRADYDDEIESMGGKIFRLSRLNPFNPAYYHGLSRFFRAHPEYKIVHCHLDCMSSIPLLVAKQCGIPVRIAHGHNSSQDKNLKYPLKLLSRKFIPQFATHFFACSLPTLEWMFPGQSGKVINNGIESDLFRYNDSVRNTMRSELGIGQELVVGHTGRFMPQKNHTFLIDIFAQLHRIQPNSRLLLIGEGPFMDTIRKKVSDLNLTDSVQFLGVRKDVHNLLQAMDIYVMPSQYEGLGIAAVEAQCSGLPCFLSDTIPTECHITDSVYPVSLDTSPSDWAEQILSVAAAPRHSGHEAVRKAGFDIQSTADYLQSFYFENW